MTENTISDLIYDALYQAGCDNCRFDIEMPGYGACDECRRGGMSWGVSRELCDKLAEEIRRKHNG